MNLTPPRLCCLDLDTFFVSVERLLDPSLEGKPVIVGGQPGKRGVVTACSYEVRRLGVHSGMSLKDAGRLAPDAIYLSGKLGDYSHYSRQVRAVIDDYSPSVQAASIDEFFIDFAGCERMYQRPEDGGPDDTIHRTVWDLLHRIKDKVGLPASAGIAAARPLAKIASGLAKPRGVIMVPAGTETEFLGPLPVGKFPGIGPVATEKLHAHGVRTLGQLAALSDPELRRLFGAWADYVGQGVRGQGAASLGEDRPAFREFDPEGGTVGSISNERTFREDMADPNSIQRMLCSLSERVCWRARKRGVLARTITLKLRYADFETLTRGKTPSDPTSSEREVYSVIQQIYRKARTRTLPVRLLGIALSNLTDPPAQLGLFDSPAEDQLIRSVDAVRERFGYKSVGLAGGRGLNDGVARE